METKKINSTWRQTIFESVGAASLLLLPFWLSKLTVLGTPLEEKYLGNFYHSALITTHVDYFAALLLTLMMGFAGFIVACFVQKRFPSSIGLAHLVCIGLAINALRIYYFPSIDLGWAKNNIAISLIFLLVVFACAYLSRRQLPTIPRLSTIFGVPLFLIFTINTGVALHKTSPDKLLSYAKLTAEIPTISHRSTSPVIWIIFDELDERVGFRERPKDIKMPALDRFRGETTVATQAIPPGDVTLYAMPTLLLGKRIHAAKYERQMILN